MSAAAHTPDTIEHPTPRLSDGKPEGDTYAIELMCPSQYDQTQMVRTVVYRNVRGASAADAAKVVPDSELSRVFAIYPERF